MWVAAIFGLVGVVIGGVLNGVVGWRVERVRTKSAAKADGRLLLGLLLDAELSFRQTADTARKCFEPDLAARVRSIQHTHLAQTLGDDAWLDLTTAEYLIEMACSVYDELDVASAPNFRTWADSIHEAVNALQPIALPDKRPFEPFEAPATIPAALSQPDATE